MYNFDNDIDDSGYFINFSIYRISYLQDKTRYYYVGDKCHNETEIKNMAHQLICKEKNFEDLPNYKLGSNYFPIDYGHEVFICPKSI